MVNQDVVAAWDAADPTAIHPTRRLSEQAYWNSGVGAAAQLAPLLPAGCTVVDYGCGDGRISIPLADLGYQVIGVDSSRAHLARLTDPRITKILTDGADLDVLLGLGIDVGADLQWACCGYVDAVVCLAVLIHYDYLSAIELLERFSNVIKPGGVLIVDLPISDRPTDTGGWIGVTTWDARERDRVLTDLGFTRVTTPMLWSAWRRL